MKERRKRKRKKKSLLFPYQKQRQGVSSISPKERKQLEERVEKALVREGNAERDQGRERRVSWLSPT